MRVALVRPPEVNPYWRVARPVLGIGYISSYLESNGIECKIFDANFNSWTEDQTVEAIVKYSPDLIGFSAMTHEICATHSLASKLNSFLSGVPTVIGGCHITALPQETLEDFSDFTYGVYGEGEKTMLQLARYLQQGKSSSLSDINGLVYRNNSAKIQINSPRTRLSSEELDNLPYPMFHQYYKGEKPLAGKNDYYVMMSSRGCPYNCIFCMQVLGRQLRRRSAKSVVDEMEYAIEQYGAHTIYFFDEIFLLNDQLTYDTMELIKKRDLPERVRWQALTRVNFVNENLIEQAKETGCFALQLGIESGNDEILKAINKNITVKEAEAAVKIIKKAGLFVEANFILGHPGETPETIKETIDLAARLNTDLLAIGIMTPYPGTKVYEMVKRGEGGYRLLTKDWSKYDKYGGKALELKGLPLKELEKWQRRGLLNFYLKNFRILDLAKFVLRYRRTIFNLLLKHLQTISSCNRFVGFFKRTAWQIPCWFISPTVVRFVFEPFFWLSGRRRDKKIDLSQVNRVLVIRLDDIGDVVLTMPFLRELRRNLPNAWITLVVKPTTFNLVELCPYVSEVLIHKCGREDRARKFYLYKQALVISFKYLLVQHFDLAIVPRWDVDEYRASFITYFSGASWSVGYSENVRENKRRYNRNYDCLFTHVLEGGGIKHEAERNLDVIRFINGNVEQDKLELSLSEEDKVFANEVLRDHRVDSDSKFVMFAPGANHPKRIWPIDRYVKLGYWLTQKCGAIIVVVGGTKDSLLGENLKQQIGTKVADVTGKTTLRQTAALSRRCCLFVGNDTGAMHLAAASGIPVVEISCHPLSGLSSHSNSPCRFGPWCAPSVVLQPEHATLPCSENCSAKEAHCILSVTVEQAKAAVKTLLFLQ